MRRNVFDTQFLRNDRHGRRIARRGVASVLAMMFIVMFGSLAAVMAVVAQGNVRTAQSHLQVTRALSAAETGLSFASRRLGEATARFVVEKGTITSDFGDALWMGTWEDGDGEAYGVVRAYHPDTLDAVWEFKMTDITWGGVLTTAGDLAFGGGREGYFLALDARTGELLWRESLGGQINAGPMSYAVDGKQYIAIAAGSALFTFALPDE
jgi:outer membrane protein assembly factor BamB